GKRRHDEEGREVNADVEQPFRRLTPALGAVEGKADHVATVDGDAVAVPVPAHAPVFLLHARERGRCGGLVLLPAVLVLELRRLGGGEQVLRVERLEPDERRVATGRRRQRKEALALRALR